MSIRISMITVAYNSSATIEKTILSVKNQCYPNLEYIIIDGGSTDGTQDIVRKHDDVVSVFVSEKDSGISDAFNKGIRYATGDLIGIINSDDYLLPNSLSVVAEEYDGVSDILMGNIFIEYGDGKTVLEIPSKSFPIIPIFKHVAHQGMFVKKGVYENLGMYDINVRYPMDLEFLMRAYKSKVRFQYINKTLAVFCYGKGVTNDELKKKKSDYIYIVEKNSGNKFYAYLYWYLMRTLDFSKRLINFFIPNLTLSLRYGRE